MGGTEPLSIGDWQLSMMGKCGVLIENRELATAVFMRLAESCRDEFQSLGLVEAIPAYDSLVLKFAGSVDMEHLQGCFEKLAEEAVAQSDQSPARVSKAHVMSVDFSKGLDWEFAIVHTGVGREEFIDSLCSIEFSVAMLGFLPGFVYLAGLPERLHLPRRPSPRVSVSPGSLAIGGEQCGIYRLPCPGGWQILGQVDLGSNVGIDQLLGQFGFGERVRFITHQA